MSDGTDHNSTFIYIDEVVNLVTTILTYFCLNYSLPCSLNITAFIAVKRSS
jgi:hypothetical protein